MISVSIPKYSQHDEQAAILSVFEGKTDGAFLDIGAYHPKVFSNTRALYEMGWHGVMIEPSPKPFLTLLEEYGRDPRVALVCAAVTADAFCGSICPLWATDDAVSTTSDEHYEKWKDSAVYTGGFYTPVLRFTDIVKQFGRSFDFVNIDSEGTSVEILLALLEYMTPKCICVEHDGKHAKVDAITGSLGYRRVMEDNGCNLVLAR